MKKRALWLGLLGFSALFLALHSFFTHNQGDFSLLTTPRVERSSVRSDDHKVIGRGPASAQQAAVSPRVYNEEQIASIQIADQEATQQIIQERIRTQKILGQWERDAGALHLRSKDQGLVTLPRLFALSDKTVVSEEAGFRFFQRSNGFQIFENRGTGSLPLGARPVVRIENTERLAILTGAFSVKYRNEKGLDEVAQRLALARVQTFEQLQLSYFQSQKNSASELVAILNELRSDPQIESADLEMVDKIYVAR